VPEANAASFDSTPRRVLVVGAGGTIAMVGRSAYDWVEYGESGQVRPVDEVVHELQPLLEGVELEVVSFRAVASTGIVWRDWVELARLVRNLAATRSDAHGIVITHGTASLEETAWFLDLVVRCPLPVVLVGAQRPPNTAGSDAAPNLRAALAVAVAPAARDLGVLVVMDNYIYGARDVRKTSNFALDAFESGEFGPLGRVDADGTVALRRRLSLPNPQAAPLVGALACDVPPRVDLALSYAGADGTAIDAFVRAGARAIVSVGMPPGRCTPAERKALSEAVAAGVLVVQSSRASRGAVVAQQYNRADGIVSGGDLAPNKLRILLMAALSAGIAHAAIGEMLHDF
jgi:L-asparaginase